MLAVHDLKRVSATVVMVLVCALLIAAPLILTGCQAEGGATHREVNETPFYLDGPQPARPADGVLAAGTEASAADVTPPEAGGRTWRPTAWPSCTSVRGQATAVRYARRQRTIWPTYMRWKSALA